MSWLHRSCHAVGDDQIVKSIKVVETQNNFLISIDVFLNHSILMGQVLKKLHTIMSSKLASSAIV